MPNDTDDSAAPWEPTGSALRMGEQVRVRLSGECLGYESASKTPRGKHRESDNDRVGTVTYLDLHVPGDTHFHVVVFYDEIPWYEFGSGAPIYPRGRFARSELERVS